MTPQNTLIPNAVIENDTLTPNALLFYMRLLQRGTSFRYTITRFAHIMKTPRTNVNRYLAELEAIDWLKVNKEADDATGTIILCIELILVPQESEAPE